MDILEGYIRTSERFRVIRVFFGVPGSYGNSPGERWALLGHTGKMGWQLGAAAPPSLGSPNWTRGGGRTPLSFSLSLPPFAPFVGGVLLGVGVLLLVGLPPLLGAPPIGASPLPPLYTEGGAPPLAHN